jgi:hypothetical protein
LDDPDFRTLQVLCDLDRVMGNHPSVDIWTTALDICAEPVRVWAAIASILRDEIMVRKGDPALDVIWRERIASIRTAPPQVRAALMNGFDYLRALNLTPEDCSPSPEDLISHPKDRIEAALISIARRMTPEELDHVARADYGCDAVRHRAALVELLHTDDLSYPPGEVWFPAEVVELVSHVPGQLGHIPCLAIILLDALRNGDWQDNASYRFANQFVEIDRLAEEVRKPFFAAFRHLYESDRSWNPVPTDFKRSGAFLPVSIPWTADD